MPGILVRDICICSWRGAGRAGGVGLAGFPKQPSATQDAALHPADQAVLELRRFSVFEEPAEGRGPRSIAARNAARERRNTELDLICGARRGPPACVMTFGRTSTEK